MSDTPRTDREWEKDCASMFQKAFDMRDKSREIERELSRALKLAEDNGRLARAADCELNAANAEIERMKNQPREIICTKCGLREERGEKPIAEF